jgi:hypothetical protein
MKLGSSSLRMTLCRWPSTRRSVTSYWTDGRSGGGLSDRRRLTIHPFPPDGAHVLLAEDTTGGGHRWQAVGDTPSRRAYVVLADGATDIVLAGAGIMSATLGAVLKELDPSATVFMRETLADCAQESSEAWNNAGTGHA